MKRPTINLALSALFLLSIIPATSVRAYEPSPEVLSRVWQEDNAEVASVTLNGKEILSFRSETSDGSAADKADEFAIKLNDLLSDKGFDANNLLPGKNGFLPALKVSTTPVLTFEPSDSSQNHVCPLEASLSVVNAIRAACNVPALPDSFLKLSEKTLQDVKVGKAQLSSNIPGHFSGQASWYGGIFHGRRTSDGSRYDQEKLTAAHRTLPFGTRLLVMNRKTGHSCVVRVNDRGPFVGDRIIDLSKGAARELNMLSSGVAMVDCLVLSNGE